MRGFSVVCAALAACTSGPSIEGNATVTVIDVRGGPVAGLPVVSSAEASVLAKGVTDASGAVTIGVAKGGEVTAYVTTMAGYESETVFDVEPGLAVEIPVRADTGPAIAPVTVNATLDASANFGGAIDLRVYAGVDGSCMAAATPGTPAMLPLAGDCLQSDGLVTVTALLYDSGGNIVGYADASDVTPGTTSPQLTIEPVAGATATSMSADFALPALPAVDTRLSTLLALSRKGNAYGVPAGQTNVAQIATVRVQGTFVDAALADSLLAAFHMSSFGTGIEAGAELWTSGATAVHLDGSVVPAPPTGIASGNRGRQTTVSVTDPADSGAFDTYLALSWANNGGVVTWNAWAAPPTAAGTRTFELPPVPADATFAPWAGSRPSVYTVSAGYNQADFAPADYRLAPEPYIPAARSSGERSYALISSHL